MDEQKKRALEFSRQIISDALILQLPIDKEKIESWSTWASQKSIKLLTSLDIKDPQFSGGLFVTLKISENLRGCIGRMWNDGSAFTLLPRLSLETAFHDYRFKPLTQSELDAVSISHSVLSNPIHITKWEDIELGNHGIIFSLHNRRSVFLPEVAIEQNWDLEQTLKHLAVKAGLDMESFRNPESEFQVFTSLKYGED
jgi:AmmeMemoRadiSam system protein A